jgi:hypothetical protein
MATITKKIRSRKKMAGHTHISKTKMSPKRKQAIEKAISFWETVQVDLSNFKFDREEANAR